MSSVRVCSLWIVLCIASAGMAFAQAVGDYGSAGTGTWGTSGTNWLVCQTGGTWTGATPAATNPTTSSNVWIRTGHTVTLDGSYNCLNLTVETGGSLVGDFALPNGTIRYLRVYGTTATINGVFGTTLAPGTNAALEPATSSSTLTIGGSGTFGPARIRVNSGASNVTTVFNIDTKFWFTGSSGTGGVALYPQTDDNVFTINAGKTLFFADYASLSVASSEGAAANTNLTINSNGSIDLSGSNSSLTLKTTTGKTATLTVSFSGGVIVGGNVSASTVADGGTTVLTVDGALVPGGTVDFSKPSFVVTGTGSFSLLENATLLIGHPGGIASSGSSGQIRTSTRSFDPGANYSYVGTASQITGTGLPATVDGLTINDTSDVSLTNSTTVDSIFTLTAGKLNTGANTLSIAATGTVIRTSGHVIGTLQKNVPVGSDITRVYEIGSGSTYAPVDVVFASVSTGGNLSASTAAGDHPNLATSTINPVKSVNRYWTINNSGIVFTTHNTTFHFASGDRDAGSSPGIYIVQSYNGSSWSSLTMGTRGSLSTQITGATGFSAFAIGEPTGAPLTPAFELNLSSVSFGNVNVGGSKVDTVFARNIGTATLHVASIASTNTPTYTVSPGSATVNVVDSAQILLTFSPTVAGSSSSKVIFTHDGASSPDTLSLSGTGVLAGAIQSNGTGGGDWLSTSTWLGGVLPTRNDSVLIRGTDSVFVLADTACNGLYMEAGARLAAYDTLRVRSSATIYGWVEANTNGRFQVADTARFQNGSTYKHARDAGNLPNGRWLAGSTLLVTGVVGNSPENGKQTFNDIIWNCPSQTSTSINLGWQPTVAAGDTTFNVNGNITVISTGAGRWNLCAPLGGTDSTHRTVARVIIHGNVNVSGGQFTATGSGNAFVDDIITTMGNISITGGNFSVCRGSQGGGTGTVTWYVNNDFSMSNATTQNSNATPGKAKFVFNKPGTQTLTLGVGNTLTSLPFEVVSGTTLNAGTSVVRGSGIVNINSGATLQCAQLGGIDSTLAGTGTRTLSPGSNYTFNGSVLQRTGRRLPDTLNTLTINNGNGVTLSDSILVNGSVVVTNGAFNLNGKLITLGPSAVLSETPGNTAVGAVQTTRNVAASSLETFGGIGLEMNTSATAPGSTVVTRVTGVASIGGVNQSIKRYFDITPTVDAGLGATMRYFYDDTELNGQAEATFQLWNSTNAGSTWNAQAGTPTPALNKIELTGVNSFATRWTASDATHPLTGATTTLNVPVLNSWNLVSLPVSSPTGGNLVQQVYTTSATTTAFYFNGSYQTTTTLAPGLGYWIKSTGVFIQSITGGVIDSITIPLNFTPSPWNIIGSISSAIDTSSARVTPSVPGLRGSSFFKYSAGYQATDSLKPGGGYWVKANFVGSFHLHNTSVPAAPTKGTVVGRSLDDLNVLTIEDANGGLQKLYFGTDGKSEIPVTMFALPPKPPAGCFDARFVAEGGMMVQTHAEEVSDVIEMPIAIQSVAYPLTVSWKVNGTLSTYELSDGSGSHEMRGEGTLKIANSAVNHLTLKVTSSNTLPKEFALSQNYPNPFNPTTNIKYALPVDSRLTMELYNILGQKVRTILAGEQAAGYHSIEWNGRGNEGQQLASGVYFLQMSAAGTNGKKFSELKKLMMMK